MKSAEIRKLSEKEREDKLAGLNQEAFNLRFQLATGQLENTARVKKVRAEIARIKTVQTEQIQAKKEG